MTDQAATPEVPTRTVEEMRDAIFAAVAGQEAEAALIAMTDVLTVMVAMASGPDQKRAVGMNAIIAMEIRKSLETNWSKLSAGIVLKETVQ